MNTDTAVKFFIAVSADPESQIAIYGIGHSADEAIADAVRGADIPSNLWADQRDTGHRTEEVFVAQPCTEALYKFVETEGGANVSWAPVDGVQDLVID